MGYSDYSDLYSSLYETSTYPTTATTSVDTEGMFAALGAALGAFMGVIFVIALAILVLQVVANWKIFVKAGEKGWKSLIPFYNTAILYKISGMSPWLVLLYLGMFIPVVNVFVAIAFAVFNLYQPINLAKGFNKSTGFTVGMIMLPFIFDLILGFGSSEYVGFDEDKTVETTAE